MDREGEQSAWGKRLASDDEVWAKEVEDDVEYDYLPSDDELAGDSELPARRIVVDIEATKQRVGQLKAYQWQKEWSECTYGGYQDEQNPLVFRVNLWQDYMVEVVLDEKHPSRPPKFGTSIPRMDAETTLLLTRMECLNPKKWNFCTKINDLLRYAEEIIRRGRPTETWRPLEQACFDLGQLLDAQPKCIETIPRDLLPQLPKFGETDEDKAARKRKLAALGWSSGTGYGAGAINSNQSSMASMNATNSAAPAPASSAAEAPAPPLRSKTEVTNRKLVEILDVIGEHMQPTDRTYVMDSSTWQVAIRPFISSASHFDFEKYEELFDKIEAIATNLDDEATLMLLRRRHPDDNTRTTKDDSRGARTTGIDVKTDYQRLLASEHVLQCAMEVPTKPVPWAPYQPYSASGARNQSSVTATTAPPSTKLIKRAYREFHTLIEGLPLSDDTAIFARHNTNNLLHFKLMIVPSNETPYAYGCYVFSVILPTNYPESPPKVLFETTDGGTVRFNPNLYNNGKVCLSLIGTWPGRPEEVWDPDTSNLLAVALSVQALIFTSEPYFNEPGYEAKRGTPEGDKQKCHYNTAVRANNKRVAIEDQYRSPPPEFASVIRKHIEYHRAAIDAAFADIQMNPTSRSTQGPGASVVPKGDATSMSANEGPGVLGVDEYEEDDDDYDEI